MTATSSHPVHRIELRIHEFAQLFNSMDPTPFLHKDLDPDAEKFIESWAMEYPAGSPLRIVVHLEQAPTETNATEIVSEAIHNYFTYRSGLVRRDLRQLLRVGRVSLVIGLAFLAICLLIAESVSVAGTSAFVAIVKESLTIGGWVAMWRPLEIFLYDWWPLVARRRVLDRLSAAPVKIELAALRAGA